MREVAAEFANPVMLYSVGKDSAVMLHLAMKAFYPSKPPFPLMHVNTTWKFKEMIQFRDETVERLGLDFIEYINQDGVNRGINPFDSGSSLHTQVMKTEALKQALDKFGFDAAFGGARRDVEKSQGAHLLIPHRHTCLGSQGTTSRALARLQHPHCQGRKHPRLPVVQLDRVGYLAIHPG
jgi:sulfate adenylyltransferase subunit 2